jgi:hypothetical protein
LNDKISSATKTDQHNKADKSEQRDQTLQLASEEPKKEVDRGLRTLITQGNKHHTNIYDALKKGNFLRDAKEYLLEETLK